MKREKLGELAFDTFFLAYVLILLWLSFDLRPESRLFPFLVMYPVAGMLLLQISGHLDSRVAEWIGRGRGFFETSEMQDRVRRRGVVEGYQLEHLWGGEPAAVVIVAVFLPLVYILGFLFAIPIYTGVFVRFYAGKTWATSLGMAFCLWLFTYGLFEYVLQIMFPRGALFEALLG